ncbi:uncharacterized protein LODBEIA_P36720 [Lodderomyces beijingensis]|uniref:Ribosomal protein L9 domain-containing protein n=1 Tax=Lodderomyces beijingensis TaxID=1775926 RepID=A0ABP0ZMR7_9ASCO
MSLARTMMRGVFSPGSVRNVYTRTARKFVEVQLLQDVPGIGVKGQLLKVKPGFMRNYLHIDNKACYVTPTTPPRIEVVDIEELRLKELQKQERMLRLKKQEEALASKQEQEQKEPVAGGEAEALSLDDLSDIFSSMKSSYRRTQKPELDLQSNSPELDFEIALDETRKAGLKSVEELSQEEAANKNDIKIKRTTSKGTLPAMVTFNASSIPIGKESIAIKLSELGGKPINPNTVQLSYIDTPDTPITNITEVGRYNVKIESFTTGNNGETVILEVE